MPTDTQERLIPAFDTEEEEIAFWRDHDPEEFDWEPADDVVWALRHRPKKPVTLRLDESLIADLKRAAEQRGVPYQTFTRGIIRRGLAALRAAERATAVPAK